VNVAERLDCDGFSIAISRPRAIVCQRHNPSGRNLVGWSLDITVVPEPVNVALGIFGIVLGGGALVHSRMARRKPVCHQLA
jgi:hypothetical protein